MRLNLYVLAAVLGLGLLEPAPAPAAMCIEEQQVKVKRVQGYFTDGGTPVNLGGRNVDLYRVSYANVTIRSTVTVNELGVFDFGSVEPGEYKVQVAGFAASDTFIVESSKPDKKSKRYLVVSLQPDVALDCPPHIAIEKHSEQEISTVTQPASP